MQSAVNVELTPEEETTMSVSANDFGDLIEGAVRVVGKPWFPECDCNETIPTPSIQELRPGIFKPSFDGVPRPTRIPGEEAGLHGRTRPSLNSLAAPRPRVTGTDPAVFGPLLDPAGTTCRRRLTG